MARLVNLEAGWLARQLYLAEERASQYPAWLTSPQTRSPTRADAAESGRTENKNSSAGQDET